MFQHANLDLKSVNRSNFNWSTMKTEDNILAKFNSKSQTNMAVRQRNPNNLYSLYKVKPKQRNVKSNYMNKRSQGGNGPAILLNSAFNQKSVNGQVQQPTEQCKLIDT